MHARRHLVLATLGADARRALERAGFSGSTRASSRSSWTRAPRGRAGTPSPRVLMGCRASASLGRHDLYDRALFRRRTRDGSGGTLGIFTGRSSCWASSAPHGWPASWPPGDHPWRASDRVGALTILGVLALVIALGELGVIRPLLPEVRACTSGGAGSLSRRALIIALASADDGHLSPLSAYALISAGGGAPDPWLGAISSWPMAWVHVPLAVRTAGAWPDAPRSSRSVRLVGGGARRRRRIPALDVDVRATGALLPGLLAQRAARARSGWRSPWRSRLRASRFGTPDVARITMSTSAIGTVSSSGRRDRGRPDADGRGAAAQTYFDAERAANRRQLVVTAATRSARRRRSRRSSTTCPRARRELMASTSTRSAITTSTAASPISARSWPGRFPYGRRNIVAADGTSSSSGPGSHAERGQRRGHRIGNRDAVRRRHRRTGEFQFFPPCRR